jgi:hypothetical protein
MLVRMKHIVATLLVAICASAQADIPIRHYAEGIKREEFQKHLVAVADGIFWANRYTALLKQPPLFCHPHDNTYHAVQFLEILDDEIRHPKSGLRTSRCVATFE